MTKNQINYLLVLATLVVLWLYFNTFYAGAKVQSRMFPMPGRPGTAMMNQPNFPYMPNRNPAAPRTDYLASLPPEAQKILEERRAALAGKLAPVSSTTTAGTTTQEKKK